MPTSVLNSWRGLTFFLALFLCLRAPAYNTTTYLCAPALDAASDEPKIRFTDDHDIPTIVPKYQRVYYPQRDDYVDPDLIPKLAIPGLGAMGYSDAKIIARGGMGTVFQAKKDGKNVIIKILHNELKHLEAFEHEAAIMNRLHGIDTRFQAGERFDFLGEDGKPLRAMEIEFIPKEPGSDESAATLAALIEDVGYWTRRPNARDSIRRQYNTLLLKAHKQGISHFDIKPANILVSFDSSGDPVVHVIDWGLASQRSDAGFLQSPAFQDGTVFGTLGYISQRRLRGGTPNEEDDVYAARIIDWHLRNSVAGEQGPVILRHLNPQGKPLRTDKPEDFASTILKSGSPRPAIPSTGPDERERDSSGYHDSFKEPAYAMDSSGTEKERMIAMAEFSLIPKTIVEREQLVVSAKVLTISGFLEKHGQLLAKMEEPALSAGMRPNLTIEILSSTVLVENFDSRSGLKLSKEDIAAVAKTAAQFYKDTRKYVSEPSRLGWFGPHHDYHYQELKNKIDELAKAGITKSWNEWLAEAR